MLADASFESDAKQLLRLHRELHWQLLENFPAEATNDHRNGVLCAESALLQIEDLIFTDL